MDNTPFSIFKNVTLETLLILLDDADGHSFLEPQHFIDMGFPFDFIHGLYKTHRGDGKSPLDAIFQPGTGKKLKRLKAVRELDFWGAVANHVGADTREAATKYGRGTQARLLVDAIVVELEKFISEPRCLSVNCDRLGFSSGRCADHFEAFGVPTVSTGSPGMS